MTADRYMATLLNFRRNLLGYVCARSDTSVAPTTWVAKIDRSMPLGGARKARIDTLQFGPLATRDFADLSPFERYLYYKTTGTLKIDISVWNADSEAARAASNRVVQVSDDLQYTLVLKITSA